MLLSHLIDWNQQWGIWRAGVICKLDCLILGIKGILWIIFPLIILVLTQQKQFEGRKDFWPMVWQVPYSPSWQWQHGPHKVAGTSLFPFYVYLKLHLVPRMVPLLFKVELPFSVNCGKSSLQSLELAAHTRLLKVFTCKELLNHWRFESAMLSIYTMMLANAIQQFYCREKHLLTLPATTAFFFRHPITECLSQNRYLKALEQLLVLS